MKQFSYTDVTAVYTNNKIVRLAAAGADLLYDAWTLAAPETTAEVIDTARSLATDTQTFLNALGSEIQSLIAKLSDDKTNSVNSFDPNSKSGPSGFGTQDFVSAANPFPYHINFENAPTASAPAQRVDITDQLDPNLDWTTFQWTSFSFGDTVITVPPNTQHFDTTVPMTYNGETFRVVIDLNLDPATGLVHTSFQSLNAANVMTGSALCPGTLSLGPTNPFADLPPDVLTGFLPPEDGTGRGTGSINYTVRPKAALPTGTQIRNTALITFDQNAAIATDQVSETDPSQGTDPTKEALVTIDAVAPTSSVSSLPAVSASTHLSVSWSGQDDAGGSGIASYDIYVSTDSGAFVPWLTATTLTSATYISANGHTYGFYSVARDNAGNVQTTPLAAQAQTVINATASIVGRSVFYNNSFFDGNNPAANAADDAAIATDKQALLPGQTATFANYTSYSKGLNGIMVDVLNLGNDAALNANDFIFKVGNNPDPTTWTIAAAPTTVLVRAGASSDRIELIWPDNAIQKQWLQVTVLADANTALVTPDVFYFGNAVGDTGNSTTTAAVDSADDLGARTHKTGLGTADLTNLYDFNRDKHVDTQDELIARGNHSGLSPLKLISVPSLTPSSSQAVAASMSTPTVTTGAVSTATPVPVTVSSVPVVPTATIVAEVSSVPVAVQIPPGSPTPTTTSASAVSAMQPASSPLILAPAGASSTFTSSTTSSKTVVALKPVLTATPSPTASKTASPHPEPIKTKTAAKPSKASPISVGPFNTARTIAPTLSAESLYFGSTASAQWREVEQTDTLLGTWQGLALLHQANSRARHKP